ncbi:hypothetical protein [Stenotrophomonas sp.]|uniref:hypothetical protein n=1 Tax=Stenotrophomonas sp. TaxID=69392 RepID=UPI0028998E96|nr:hypothetical protein [Stenotrophomonas sp.]
MARGGKREGAGRPKGAIDKNNKQLREMILEALEKNGGVKYLAQQAKDQPKAFLSLLGRVLPMQVTGAGGGEIEVAVKVVERRIVRPVDRNG